MAKKKQNRGTTVTNNTPEPSATDTQTTAVEQHEDAVTETQAEDTVPVVEETEAAPAVVEAPPVTPAPTMAAQNVIADTMVDPALRQALQLLDDQLERYRTTMAAGRPVGEVEGAKQQQALWRVIDGILRRTGNDFTVLFTRLLEFMNRESQEKHVLSARLRYRFFGALTLGRDEARSFESILAALINLANPRDRVLAMRQVDLPRVFSHYPDKGALARVSDYFNV